MSGKAIVTCVLLVALVACSADASQREPNKEANVLQQLLAKRDKVTNLSARQERPPWARTARMERRAHLSEDERETMTKQIVQAISEMMNSECMSDRDYQGWVDFGRRDAD